ncbi:MAG: hypothetical protein UR93_C0023G0023 [Berkelbacteria bacterium GW2011_GWA2_35_9]|uniref:YdbS-like PH domain-containing protein n=1 Tax=Berkelbacteria bacterium GW2011_GWA2_35_9 TaxID=1618333 RepID=A0A0G0D1B9_9BACT|nr:MAG: hypothetical protein UR93_C0023G0023 [Berkelbacteria bacterium GW2011_GWA2_35_9]
MDENKIEDFTFEGQEEDESVLLVTHQHPLTFTKESFILIISILILVIIFYLQSGLGGIFSYVFIVLLLINGYLMLKRYIIWRNSVYVITDKRLIAVEQKSFFRRVMTEANLDKVQNVAHEINGFWQTIFNYGNVIIQTGGYSEKNMVLEQIHHPLAIQQKIMKIASQYGGAPLKIDLNRDVKKDDLVIR